MNQAACRIVTRILMSTNKTKRPVIQESPNDTVAVFLHIHTSLLTAFFNKNAKNIKNNVEAAKNRI